MSDLGITLHVSPKKKRCPPEPDELTLTPKKLRTVPPTPPSTSRKKGGKFVAPLPPHLSRLQTVQAAIQHALSHALATCAVSPSSDTGIIRNVLNHFSLTTYTGLTTKFDVDDLRRLCWLWEWDGKSLPHPKSNLQGDDDDENPFLDPHPPSHPKDWTRGSMGLVLSPTSHLAKDKGKRIPAYGIGIEVEMDIDRDMKGGMAAVARWTAASETRLQEFRGKLDRWINLHSDVNVCPNVPFADLPQLCTTSKSSLARIFASASPKASSHSSQSASPSSDGRSPLKSPTKKSSASRRFAAPSTASPPPKVSPTSKNSIAFPKTPSHHNRPDIACGLLTPRTPRPSLSGSCTSENLTPTPQKGSSATTFPETPSSSRRQALYERVRQRSLSTSPTKPSSTLTVNGKELTDQMLKMSQDEMRRRCLLGRLGGVAESIWMLFSTPAGPVATPTARKRRVLPTSEVITAIVKSSPVPISSAEATQSLAMLTDLCPFFLKSLEIGGSDWLEMPGATTTLEGTDVQSAPSSPGRKKESAEVLVHRSPKWVKREVGGLREVRELIRRELELQD